MIYVTENVREVLQEMYFQAWQCPGQLRAGKPKLSQNWLNAFPNLQTKIGSMLFPIFNPKLVQCFSQSSSQNWFSPFPIFKPKLVQSFSQPSKAHSLRQTCFKPDSIAAVRWAKGIFALYHTSRGNALNTVAEIRAFADWLSWCQASSYLMFCHTMVMVILVLAGCLSQCDASFVTGSKFLCYMKDRLRKRQRK